MLDILKALRSHFETLFWTMGEDNRTEVAHIIQDLDNLRDRISVLTGVRVDW